MRICLIAPSLSEETGWSQYTRGLAMVLSERGHEVLIICEKVDTSVALRQEAVLGEPLSYMANPWRAFREAKRAHYVLATFKPDIIHITCEPYLALARFWPKKYRILLTVHGTYCYIPRLQRSILRRALSHFLFDTIYRRVDSVVAVSRYTKDQLVMRAPWIDQSKIHIIPNGIDRVHEERPWQKPQVPRLLFVGAVKQRKGVREIIEGIAAYRQSCGPIELHIIGSLTHDKPYVREVQERVKTLGLESSVIWHGFASDEELTQAYRDADIFAMLPQEGEEFEGFGLVYLEANAWSVPCAGTKGSAAEDAISEGKSGFLIDAKDANAFAVAVKKTIDGSNALRHTAQQWAEEHTWDMITRRYEQHYKTITR